MQDVQIYEYLKSTVMKLQTKIMTQNTVKSINEHKKNYQARSNLVKDKTGDLLADYHSILDITFSSTECTYIELMVLSIMKCTQMSHHTVALSF